MGITLNCALRVCCILLCNYHRCCEHSKRRATPGSANVPLRISSRWCAVGAAPSFASQLSTAPRPVPTVRRLQGVPVHPGRLVSATPDVFDPSSCGARQPRTDSNPVREFYWESCEVAIAEERADVCFAPRPLWFSALHYGMHGARRTFDAAHRTSHGRGRLYGGANIFAELKFSRVNTDSVPQWHQRLTRRHHIHCLARKTLTRGYHT